MCGVSSTTFKKNHYSSQFAFRESFRRGLQKVAEISNKGKDSNFHGFDGIFSYPPKPSDLVVNQIELLMASDLSYFHPV